MELPFTAAEFFEVFRRYNEAVWPLQVLLYAIALLPLAAALARPRLAGRAALLSLAALWLWIAVVYQWIFFSPVNGAAKGFAILFALGAGVFAYAARRPRALAWPGVAWSTGGVLLIAYGLLGYPLAGWLAGHRFPAAPTFGLPCPTTIFTIGLLTFVAPRPPQALLVAPILWSIVGSSAAFQLGVPEDYGLAVAGGWALALAVSGGERAVRTNPGGASL